MPGVLTGRDLLRITINTRNDLLFTMSDITRPLQFSRAFSSRESILRTDTNLFLRTSFRNSDWWSQTGSNRRPPACKAGALPAELWPLVGLAGLPTEARG